MFIHIIPQAKRSKAEKDWLTNERNHAFIGGTNSVYLNSSTYLRQTTPIKYVRGPCIFRMEEATSHLYVHPSFGVGYRMSRSSLSITHHTIFTSRNVRRFPTRSELFMLFILIIATKAVVLL
jgi:hypothetical protein